MGAARWCGVGDTGGKIKGKRVKMKRGKGAVSMEYMKEQQKHRIHLLIVFFVPILIASLIRFWNIDLRPFHSDEGVNGNFLLNLYNNNYYHYDPANYHGPFLYYIGLIPSYIFGFTDFSF